MTVTVTTPDSAETLWVVSDRLRFLGQMPGTDLHLIEVTVPPGSGTPPHRHQSPEMFHILEGEITFGDFTPGAPPRMTRATPGTVVAVPGMEPHNYQNTGTTTARMLVFLEPSLIAFFREIGEATPPSPQAEPDFGAVMAAMSRHGIAMAA